MIDLIEFDKILLDYFTSKGMPDARYLMIVQSGSKAMIAGNLPAKQEAIDMLRAAIATIKESEPMFLETVGSA